ncbi:tumor necrosis factor receptor superfamily member 18 [Ascaphus truei]|uniref:tumor necrosis factor receptor superfamily member 18 n=1 Tax=Ascaphus truei TaxID=8439 RepID=UPI003F59756A
MRLSGGTCQMIWSLLGSWWLLVRLGTGWAVNAECDMTFPPVTCKEGIPSCKKGIQANPPVPCRHDGYCCCSPGYVCTGKPCEYCIEVPPCGKGNEPKRIGQFVFSYPCKPCENGTYSDTENGSCKPWTKCTSKGLETMTTGNKTNDVKCVVSAVKKAPEKPEVTNAYSYLYIALSAVALLILILLSIVFHLFIWKMKTNKLIKAAVPQPPPVCAPLRLKEEADSWSCQFPEEEHGEKAMEKDFAVLHSRPLG